MTHKFYLQVAYYAITMMRTQLHTLNRAGEKWRWVAQIFIRYTLCVVYVRCACMLSSFTHYVAVNWQLTHFEFDDHENILVFIVSSLSSNGEHEQPLLTIWGELIKKTHTIYVVYYS